MPPEQPPFLVILDVSHGSAGVSARAEFVQPKETLLRVRWGVGSPPSGYLVKGGGVVFVSGERSEPKPPDEAPNLNMSGEWFTYSEGFDGAPWLMLVIVLPQGQELTDVTPAPAGSRLHGDRLALYWRLFPEPRTPQAAVVSGRFRKIANLGEALTQSAARDGFPFDPEDRDPKFQLFLSYRKHDDRWAVGRIHRLLTQYLGENSVFRDVDSIRLGKDFRTSIDDAVGRCRILLAVIGPYWLDPNKPVGQRRVDSTDDWPRIEIESALQRHKLVVPVLLDDTKFPRDGLLPASLQELPYLQGMALREDSFASDIEALVKRLRVLFEEPAH
jgi:hypothetical protein